MGPEKIVVTPNAAVKFATNVFVDFPTILQFEQTRLLWVERGTGLELDAAVDVYHADGGKLGVIRSGRFFPTEDGKKANVNLRHEAQMYALELNGQTLLEVRKPQPRELHPTIELYTPHGLLVRGSPTAQIQAVGSASNAGLQLNGVTMTNNYFHGGDVGIWFDRHGSMMIGGAPPGGVAPQLPGSIRA